MSEWEEACLEEIGHGMAIKKFDVELQRAIENCMDKRTEAGATREVKLIVKIKPNDDRSSAILTFQAQSKLAPDMAGTEHMTFSDVANTGFIHRPQQLSLDKAYDKMVKPNQTPINEEE